MQLLCSDSMEGCALTPWRAVLTWTYRASRHPSSGLPEAFKVFNPLSDCMAMPKGHAGNVAGLHLQMDRRKYPRACFARHPLSATFMHAKLPQGVPKGLVKIHTSHLVM